MRRARALAPVLCGNVRFYVPRPTRTVRPHVCATVISRVLTVVFSSRNHVVFRCRDVAWSDRGNGNDERFLFSLRRPDEVHNTISDGENRLFLSDFYYNWARRVLDFMDRASNKNRIRDLTKSVNLTMRSDFIGLVFLKCGGITETRPDSKIYFTLRPDRNTLYFYKPLLKTGQKRVAHFWTILNTTKFT